MNLRVALSLVLSIDRAYRRWVSAEIEGGGRATIYLQYPGNSQNAAYFNGVPYIYQVALDLFLHGSVRVNLWFLDFQYEWQGLSGHYVYPNYHLTGYLGIPVWLQDRPKGQWTQPDRRYLSGQEPYHQVMTEAHIFPQDDPWDVREQRLIQNAYPFANPSLAWKAGNAVIAYNYDEPSLPAPQSTEIRALHQQPDGTWQDKRVTQDILLDSQPRITLSNTGQLVAVWTRLNAPVAENDPPESRLAKAEIAYSVYDESSGVWGTPILLTSDNRMDLNPQPVQGADGHLYLTWLKSPDNVFPTDMAAPVVPHTDIWIARWDGSAFVEAQPAVQRADTQEVAMGVSASGSTILVWVQDVDGDAATRDTRLVSTHWTGSGWSAIQPVWTNGLPQGSPTLSIGSNSTPVLYFVRSGLAHPQHEDHEMEELLVTSFTGSQWYSPASVTRASTFNDLNVLTQPDGRVSALWMTSSQGVADLWSTVYDIHTQYYSDTVRLTHDDLTHEVQLSVAWDPAGNPSAVYLKRRLEMQDRQVEDEQGNPHTLPVVVPVGSDLYVLAHRPKPDLTIDEIVLDPSNPGPGEQVNVTARARNLRAMNAPAVQVRFYDGDPDDGGAVIGTRTVNPDPLIGGSSGQASLQWTVPTDGQPHVLYAVVDPDNAIQETNEENNSASYAVAVLDLEAVAPIVQQYLPDGTVRLEFGIRNPSPVTPAGQVRYELRRDNLNGMLIAEGTVPSPAAGQVLTLTEDYVHDSRAPGRYSLCLRVDTDDRFAEENEQNNTATGTLALLPDLVLNPVLSNVARTADHILTIQTTLQNIGWAAAQNVVVQVLDGAPGSGRVLASQTVGAIGRYEDRNLTFQIAQRDVDNEVWIVANPTGAIDEVRRDNNEVILPVDFISGDVNDDGCVDDADLLAVLFAFGSDDEEADLNGDGIVDDADLLEVLFNFGSGC